MRRTGLCIALATAVLLLVPTIAGADTSAVEVKDFSFDPSNAFIMVGDALHWSRATGSVASHSVTANNGFFDSGDPTTGAIDLTATFSAGTFHYFCKVHGSPDGSPTAGMNGLVRVPAATTGAPGGLPFTVTWATPSTTTGTTWDVQYRAGSGPWKAWLSKTGLRKGVFGKNGKPVTLHKGTSFKFRVRSRTPAGASGWSPATTFSV
jgi:plastocyanin